MSPRPQTPRSDHAVYPISVAAELSGVATQSLRLFESHGLIAPQRTPGGTRRYSADDMQHIDHISALIGRGLNLAGVGMVLALESENGGLRTQNAGLRTQNAELRASMPGASTDDPLNTTAKGDSHDQ